jgi:hypothetical protein
MSVAGRRRGHRAPSRAYAATAAPALQAPTGTFRCQRHINVIRGIMPRRRVPVVVAKVDRLARSVGTPGGCAKIINRVLPISRIGACNQKLA